MTMHALPRFVAALRWALAGLLLMALALPAPARQGTPAVPGTLSPEWVKTLKWRSSAVTTGVHVKWSPTVPWTSNSEPPLPLCQ